MQVFMETYQADPSIRAALEKLRRTWDNVFSVVVLRELADRLNYFHNNQYSAGPAAAQADGAWTAPGAVVYPPQAQPVYAQQPVYHQPWEAEQQAAPSQYFQPQQQQQFYQQPYAQQQPTPPPALNVPDLLTSLLTAGVLGNGAGPSMGAGPGAAPAELNSRDWPPGEFLADRIKVFEFVLHAIEWYRGRAKLIVGRAIGPAIESRPRHHQTTVRPAKRGFVAHTK